MKRTVQDGLGMTRKRTQPAKWLPWVLSVLIALVLWVVAIQNRIFTVSMTLQVRQPQLPRDLMLVSELPAESVTVEFAGSGGQVLLDQLFRQPSGIELGEISVERDAQYPLDARFTLSTGNVAYDGPRALVLMARSFSPASVTLVVDRKVSRSIPVSVPPEGNIPGRFMWPVLSRYSVDIMGAASVVSSLDSISTDPVIPGENMTRVGIVLPEGVSGSSPQTVSASYAAPVPVVFMGDK